jgi:hypothetical protein
MFDTAVKELTVGFQSFFDLDKIHRIADRLFVEHQIACMHGKWDEALYPMEMMYELRLQNIRDEDEILLPIYQSNITEVPEGGALKFFYREHKLIKKKLNSLIQNMSNIVLNESGDSVNLVELFEEYHSFKDLLDHHDSRERVFLYKLLDEKTDIGDRKSVLKEINTRQADLMHKIGRQV